MIAASAIVSGSMKRRVMGRIPYPSTPKRSLRLQPCREMNLTVLIILVAACVVLFVLERTGVPTTLELHFKGDIKRESRWFAQYGQSMCTPVAALLVWQLDPKPGLKPVMIVTAVLGTSIVCA